MSREHRVRQVLAPGNWSESDPFLMLAEDWFPPGTFGDHPHRGFETVTLVLEGGVEHRDNHGGHGVLHPGDAQWMTAGRGVVHSEEAVGHAHTLQLWVNLPRRLKMTEPRYQDLRANEVPVRQLGGATLRVYSGASGDVVAPTRNHVPVTMIEIVAEAGATFTIDIAAQFNTFIYVLAGRARVADTEAQAGQVVWLAQDGDELAVAADESLRAILWGGSPIGEPVVQYGPFVMNTMGEIRQAMVDFQEGRF
jgi:redox-sensitive bicupin YhaK (pirin superfamily)